MWHKAMLEIFPKYEINTPNRIAGFVAQCAHESNNFNTLEENLNYSEAQLLKVFGRYFGPSPKRDAKEYAKNPEKIANYVYMDEFRVSKMGNVKPGDGWLFRGRGLKQLTGRENYTKKLNAVADTGDIVKMTKIINGGDIGLADRKKRYDAAIAILSGNKVPTAPILKVVSSSGLDLTTTLNVGSTGDTVKALQTKLGLNADGTYELRTKRAVKDWQAKNGLTADGVAGPVTLKKLLG